MRKFFIFLFILKIFLSNSLLAYSSNTQEFISELVIDAITKLSDKNLNKEEKSEFIEKIALENVDMTYAGEPIVTPMTEDEIAGFQREVVSIYGY